MPFRFNQTYPFSRSLLAHALWTCTLLCLFALLCTTAYAFDDDHPQKHLGLTMGADPWVNACAEGQFLDLSSGQCRPLNKTYGFTPDTFLESFTGQEHVLTECTALALQNLLNAVGEQGGGTVYLPACSIEVEQQPIRIPSNTILQGAGVGQTLFRASNWDGWSLLVQRGENVIIRDLSIDGVHRSIFLIWVEFSSNVLIERVELFDAEGSGVNFTFSKKITVRYSASYGHKEWHGLATKDCFPHGQIWDVEACERWALNRVAADVSPGALWTHGYALYSNYLYSNGGFGVDSHAVQGEIAGNWISDNGFGAKFPDASRLWMHHNYIADNRNWGIQIYGIIIGRDPTHLVFYENFFLRNGEFTFRVKGGQGIYLIDNLYERNMNAGDKPWDGQVIRRGTNALRTTTNIITDSYRVAPVVYVCSGSSDADLRVYGPPINTASVDQCGIDVIGELFGPEPIPDPADTPDLSITNTEQDTPEAFAALEPNYPNPFRLATTIAYALPEDGHVKLEIFDVLGRPIATLVDQVQPAGRHTASFAAQALPPGTYFYRLQTAQTTRTLQMTRMP